MYAIVEIAGVQYRVEKDMKLKVPLMKMEPGKTVDFERVLLLEDDKGNVTIGDPLVKNTSVSAKIVDHGKDKKVIVFKKKRRKGYQKKRGHRQNFSMVEITAIGAAKKTTEKATATADKPAAAAKQASKPETKTTKTADAAKKPATKKAAAKPKTTTKTTSTKTTAAKKAPAKKTTTAKKTTPSKKDVKED